VKSGLDYSVGIRNVVCQHGLNIKSVTSKSTFCISSQQRISPHLDDETVPAVKLYQISTQ